MVAIVNRFPWSRGTDPGRASATALTLTGPTTSTVGAASSAFTVSLFPVGSESVGAVTVTPDDASDGGTFTPSTVLVSGPGPTATFTYTAASAGTKTIGITNSGSLTDPSDVSLLASYSFGALQTAASGMAAGDWLNWSSSTNVAAITDVHPTDGGLTYAWLESEANSVIPSWPGNATWDEARAQVVLVGASAGHSSETPVGDHSAAIYLDVTTGTFSKVWNPISQNISHVYDGNCTQPLNGYIYRRAYTPNTLWRCALTTDTWTQVSDLSGAGLYADATSLDILPGMGASGSVIICGFNGRLVRFDIATAAITVLATSHSGVGGLHVVCSYHPSISAIVFGGGESGTSLYKINAAGTITLVSNTLPSGVPGIGPDGSICNTVLSPDPQGRAYAWLFDELTTRKTWRLDLSAGTWTDMGAVPSTFGTAYGACAATIPELGVHLFFDGQGRLNSSTSYSKVWLYKPA